MKIFRFFSGNASDEATGNNDMIIKVLPDTALLIQKRPFFIPDFTQDCRVQMCYAVRINRLGRSIHEKFAHRYYDEKAITLGVHFVANDLMEKLIRAHRPYDLAVGFDNAVAVSESHVEGFMESKEISMQLNDERVTCPVDKSLTGLIDQQIAQISSYYTLKQGDILLYPVALSAHSVVIDTRVSLFMDEQELLAFNVK